MLGPVGSLAGSPTNGGSYRRMTMRRGQSHSLGVRRRPNWHHLRFSLGWGWALGQCEKTGWRREMIYGQWAKESGRVFRPRT